MKTKSELLTAINQCLKMGKKGETTCCSKCPYKARANCYSALLRDLREYVINDVTAFISYLKHNVDYELKGDEQTVIARCIDINNLEQHFEEMKGVDEI